MQRSFSAFVVAIAAALATSLAQAQTPGEWRYRITTELTSIPAFAACRSADDFASGRAFALQTLASSAARCPSTGFVRAPIAGGIGESLRFIYACDEGKTLSGMAQGRVQATRFSVVLESRYAPPVNGVDTARQTMSAIRVGACKVKPDTDGLKVK